MRVVALTAAGLLLWRGADVLWGENLACIVEGEAYRSAQLTSSELERTARELGLRSVVNLRGENDAGWYRREIECCRRLGIEHHDVAMSARQLPNPDALERLVEILRDTPTPVLIHCKNGADRTGLASTIYLALRCGMEEDQAAESGLSTWRGHVPAGATSSLDEFFRLRREHDPGMEFSRWVREVYPSLYRERAGHEGAHG